MLYRILTENKDLESINRLVGEMFASYTLIQGTGYWHFTPEPCLIIEIATFEDYGSIKALAYQIKHLNRQEAILIQSIPCESELL